MDLFTYLLAKNNKFSLVHKSDLFSYLLGKNNSIPLKTAEGVTITIEALKTKINELKMTKESTQDGTPTPDNPIPVEVVEGYIKDGNNYVDVTVRGKNLFKSKLEIGGISEIDGTNVIAPAINRIRTNDYIPINDVTNTLSWIPNNYVMYGYCYDSSKRYLGITSGWNNTPFTFIPRANTAFIRFVWRKSDNSALTINDISNIQLEQGSVATSYEPYKESIVPIPLNGNFIAGIGDYKDILMVDKSGKCYLNKKIEKVVLNGSESWNYHTSSGNFYVENIITDRLISNLVLSLSNYYSYFGIASNGVASVTENNKYAFQNTTPEVYGRIIVRDTRFNNVESFKSWLSTHNTDVYYPLEQEELIDLNYTVDLKLYIGENNISNSEDMMMTLKYY